MQLQWWWWRIQYMGVGEARAIFTWPRGEYRNDFSLRWLSRDEGETQTVHNTEAENKSGDCSGVISRVGQKQQSDYFSLWKSSSRYCNPWKPRQFFLTITTYSSWLDVSEEIFCCRRGSNSNWIAPSIGDDAGSGGKGEKWSCPMTM